MGDDAANKAGAMKVRMPLYRQKPWLSDSVWCAHESLPLFDRFAALMPLDGRYKATADGFERSNAAPVALRDFMVSVAAEAKPCVVNFTPALFDSTDEAFAADHSGEVPATEVVDEAGTVWRADTAILTSLSHARRPLTWKLAVKNGRATLVGFDHKDRPRFALATFGTAPEAAA